MAKVPATQMPYRKVEYKQSLRVLGNLTNVMAGKRSAQWLIEKVSIVILALMQIHIRYGLFNSDGNMERVFRNHQNDATGDTTEWVISHSQCAQLCL